VEAARWRDIKNGVGRVGVNGETGVQGGMENWRKKGRRRRPNTLTCMIG
jgi:hypothetical protein